MQGITDRLYLRTGKPHVVLIIVLLLLLFLIVLGVEGSRFPGLGDAWGGARAR